MTFKFTRNTRWLFSVRQYLLSVLIVFRFFFLSFFCISFLLVLWARILLCFFYLITLVEIDKYYVMLRSETDPFIFSAIYYKLCAFRFLFCILPIVILPLADCLFINEKVRRAHIIMFSKYLQLFALVYERSVVWWVRRIILWSESNRLLY